MAGARIRREVIKESTTVGCASAQYARVGSASCSRSASFVSCSQLGAEEGQLPFGTRIRMTSTRTFLEKFVNPSRSCPAICKTYAALETHTFTRSSDNRVTDGRKPE